MTTDYLIDLLPRVLPGLKIEKRLPVSGQRAVYFCVFESPAPEPQPQWGRCVLKASEELSAKQIAYLQKEIEILNSLTSPYYPKLHFNEVFTDDPDSEERLRRRLFITIEEFIESRPLSECCSEHKSERDCIVLMQRLVKALSVLWNHKNKIIHRDIKPANILVKSDGDVVIIDLGIVREEGVEGLTEAWFPVGPCTPAYASPEQAVNDKKNISFKSDFFSLGILAYEICSGINPFSAGAETGEEILGRIIKFSPPELYTVCGVSEKFSAVVHRLLEKEPYKRFRTIDAFEKALNDCLEVSS